MSTTGSVFGIATIAQYPPAAAASVPDAIVSSSSRPGVRRCTCGSTNAGARTSPAGARRDRLDRGHDPVLDRHARRHVEPLAGVDDPGADRQRVEAAVPAREHHATSSATAATSSAGRREQVVEDRHPHDEAGAHLRRDERRAGVGDARVDLDAPVHRAGVHHDLPRPDALGRDAVERRVLAQGRDERGAGLHPLRLHAEHVDDVDVGDRLDPVADRAAELLDPARDQRRRPDEHRLGTDEEQRLDERAGDARVEDVADDRDRDAVEAPERLADREEVEQRLRRVLVLPVPGVDDVRAGRRGDELRRADVRMADDDHVGVVLRQRLRRVPQRLALVDRRAGGAERHRVRGEPLGGELEARERARRRLVEEVEDEPAAERRQLLHLAVERPRRVRGPCRGCARRRCVVRSPTPRRWRVAGGRSSRASRRLEHDPVDPVDLLELDADPLRERGREVLADVVRADRQLAMAAIDEHGELHALGPPVVEERVDRSPDRAAREEHVVDEHARRPLEREAELRAANDGLRVERRRASADEDVVAMEGDVDRAERGLDAAPLGDELLQPPRERHAARVDADERERSRSSFRSISSCASRASVRASASASRISRAASRAVVSVFIPLLLSGLAGPA